MRTKLLCLFRETFYCLLLAALAWMVAGNTAEAQTSVTTLGGGNPNISPKYQGYSDGNTLHQALFHTPCGLAMDSSGQFLFVADRDNNAIRQLDLVAGTTATLIVTYTNLINRPIGVAVDVYDDVYVLNTNGSIYTFDCNLFSPTYGEVLTNALHLINARGMALDDNDDIFVTVQSNKLIRIAAFSNIQTTNATIPIAGTYLQGITVKHDGLIAACDSGRNGIYLIDPNTGIYTTNAGFHGMGDFITNAVPLIAAANSAKFNRPMCVVEAGDGTLIVSDYGNNRVKAVLTSGIVSNLFGVTAKYWGGLTPGWYDGPSVAPDSHAPNEQSDEPFGLAFGLDGTIYDSEDFYHLIRKATASGLALPPPPPPLAPATLTATPNYGQIYLSWTASTGATNYNIKRSTTSGGETTIVSVSGATTAYTDTNVFDGTTYYYEVSALDTSGESANSQEASATPLFSPVPTNVMVVATNYGVITLSWAASAGATSYNIYRATSTGALNPTLVGSTSGTTFNDMTVVNGVNYFYVVTAVNGGGVSGKSAEAEGTAPVPPPPPARIGWYDYEGNDQTGFFTVLHPVVLSTFNNDQLLAVDPDTNGVNTYYVAGPAPLTSIPSSTNGTTPPFYADGQSFVTPLPITIIPDLVIKAVNVDSYGQSSPITTAEFIFQVGNPTISGNNAALFSVSDVTSNSVFWYTTDGTDPTNASPSIGPITEDANGDPISISLNITTNTVFRIRAFKNGYYPSGVAVASFSPGNFSPNTISFGFGNNEGSSAFIASAGQTFYAPVTLTLVTNSPIYSMQFNLVVTNGVTNSGPPIPPGTFGFNSLLEEPEPGTSPVLYEYIPPAMFVGLDSVPNPINFNGTTFSSLLTTNTGLDLIGVGWVERIGETNLYDTAAQTLITYSQAHDTQFLSSGGKVIVGGFNIQIPVNAQTNQTYQIQIGRPSATSDGVGAPGSDVFIYAPTNDGTGPGTINALKSITIGQFKYIVGSVYPFNWFNAGDFGSSNIVNADVEQVFEAAVYQLNSPVVQAPGSDFFDAMDSSGSLGALDLDPASPNYNYYTNAGAFSYDATFGSENPLFDGNDTTINQDIFGDGVLDVSDVYVTFRRSLDPSLTWFRRFWNNGQRVADAGAPNIANHLVKSSGTAITTKLLTSTNTTTPQVNFTAGVVIGAAGKTVQIPITATIVGSYPLRVLMLNLTVTPLDGSPALTAPVSFIQTATALGAPYLTDSDGVGNYAAVWLNSTNSGLTGTSTIGFLNMTIPSTATSTAAYAVHFDHASGSPNGLASFPKSTLTGLVTTTSRTNSSYADGIPDSWRLRWFGTIYNILSVSNACPSGDGVDNWYKYIAGVDPSVANDFPKLNSLASAPSGYNSAIHWPSVNGVQYIIERSSTLFSTPWSILSTNNGTGGDMQYYENNTNKVRFYRVLIRP